MFLTRLLFPESVSGVEREKREQDLYVLVISEMWGFKSHNALLNSFNIWHTRKGVVDLWLLQGSHERVQPGYAIITCCKSVCDWQSNHSASSFPFPPTTWTSIWYLHDFQWRSDVLSFCTLCTDTFLSGSYIIFHTCDPLRQSQEKAQEAVSLKTCYPTFNCFQRQRMARLPSTSSQGDFLTIQT